MKFWGVSVPVVSVLCIGGLSYAQEGEPRERENQEAEPRDDGWMLDAVAVEAVAVDPHAGGVAVVDGIRSLGATSLVTEQDLEQANYSDPNRVLYQVPGVTVREEDGFGLRPNIGIRGVDSDRSKKVTLMEDGVLFAPAPYSAPAAYYFPSMGRVVGVDVYKGASTLLYGPATVGGAVDLRTRSIPETGQGALNLALGRFGSRRVNAHIGTGWSWGGFVLDVADMGSRGFKTLDVTDGFTGFTRDELVWKGQVHTPLDRAVVHRVGAKIGYGWEQSRESYLGLEDGDLNQDPNRRYAAGQRDRMIWRRSQINLRYELDTAVSNTRVVLYRNDLDRTWRRLDRFRDGPSLVDTLRSPSGVREVYYNVLTGTQDSASVLDPAQDQEDLIVTSNERTFVSRGVQATHRTEFDAMGAFHEVEVGVRLHNDSVQRNHTERGYRMSAGRLSSDGQSQVQARDDLGEATALSAYLSYLLEIGRWTWVPSARTERIWTRFEDVLAVAETDRIQQVWLPGMRLQLDRGMPWSFFGGVHRGFAPVTPGQDRAVDPETSWNYELGARLDVPLDDGGWTGEAVAFVNDYGNLSGQCTTSSGCGTDQLGEQFNGGEALVWGLELALAKTLELSHGHRLTGQGSYTWTRGQFDTDFSSDNPLFGDVSVGDRLPYLPVHRGQLRALWEQDRLSAGLGATVVGEMREQAGQGEPEPGALPLTDRYVLMDAQVRVRVGDRTEFSLRGENLLNQQPIVARRPFGARTVHPLQVWVGMGVEL